MLIFLFIDYCVPVAMIYYMHHHIWCIYMDICKSIYLTIEIN